MDEDISATVDADDDSDSDEDDEGLSAIVTSQQSCNKGASSRDEDLWAKVIHERCILRGSPCHL